MGDNFYYIQITKPLKNMNIKARMDEKLDELMYYLAQYDFQINYVSGKDNPESDCLSQNPFFFSSFSIMLHLSLLTRV